MSYPHPTKKYLPEPHKLCEYDLELIEKARKLLFQVYEYHYGDSYMQKEVRRLETIISKINSLKEI